MNLTNMLPDEILSKIFSFLPSSDLCSVNQVCKRWMRTSNDPFAWRDIDYEGRSAAKLKKLLKGRVTKLTKSFTIKLSNSFSQSFTPNDIEIFNKDGANIRKLQIESGLVGQQKFFWDNLPFNSLEELTLVNCDVTFKSFKRCSSLENFAGIRRLSFIHSIVHSTILTSLVDLKHLETLRIVEKEYCGTTLQLVFSALPKNMKKLELNTSQKNGKLWWNEIPINGLEELILANFEVTKTSEEFEYSMESFPKLKSLSLIHTRTEYCFIERFYQLTNLEKLDLIGKEIFWPLFLVKVIPNIGGNIKFLNLTQMDIGQILGSSELSDILVKTPYLEELTLNYCLYLPHDVFHEIVNQHPAICPNLRTVKAKGTALTLQSLPGVWRCRGILLCVDN